MIILQGILLVYKFHIPLFVFGATSPSGPRPPHLRGF